MDTEFGGIFIVLGVTALAFAQLVNMGVTGPWETNWIVINLEGATGPAGLFTFSHALETSIREEVVTRFRLTWDSSQARKDYFKYENYVRISVVNMQHELPYPPPFPCPISVCILVT